MRPSDLPRLRAKTLKEINFALSHYKKTVAKNSDFQLIWYIGMMAAVDMHATWERFAEGRLIVALNHDPSPFITANLIRGIKRIPVGLATVLVRSGARYFDFRSTGELIDKGDRLLGKSSNPFRKIPEADRKYLDTLSAVRNCIVHRSTLAFSAYKRSIRKTYGIKSAPEPEEFLAAVDRRVESPARNDSRLHGLATVLRKTIRHS